MPAPYDPRITSLENRLHRLEDLLADLEIQVDALDYEIIGDLETDCADIIDDDYDGDCAGALDDIYYDADDEVSIP